MQTYAGSNPTLVRYKISNWNDYEQRAIVIENVVICRMNYVLVVACALSIPATALTKATYRRLDVDEPENSSPISFLRVDDSQVSISPTFFYGDCYQYDFHNEKKQSSFSVQSP